MKWFKHFSDASNDEFISDLEDEFGLIGYGRWWKLLESIAAQMEAGSNKCSASYSEKKWCRKLQCKPKVLVRFLECTDNAGKTKTERSGNILEISCCKLLELRDNHSKNLQVDRKQLAPDLPLDVDVEVEVEKTINVEKDKTREICINVIAHLNLKTGKTYRDTTAATHQAINGRLGDGYTLDDFKKVIDSKSAEWKDTDMEKHLSPSTLFRPSNFEKYLQNATETTDDYNWV